MHLKKTNSESNLVARLLYTLQYKHHSVQSHLELRDFKSNVQTKSSFTVIFLFLMPVHSTGQTAQVRVKYMRFH